MGEFRISYGLKPGAVISVYKQLAYRNEHDDPSGYLDIKCELTGRYFIEEFQPYDRAAHVHEAGYTVVEYPVKSDSKPLYFIPMDDPDDAPITQPERTPNQ
jgi:hypothetical protein